jgi:hypothetical protein
VFENLCEAGIESKEGKVIDQVECEGISEGILKQGLHTALVTHWDILRQIYAEFLLSDRSKEVIIEMLNDDIYDEIEIMHSKYMNRAAAKLDAQLQDDIDDL